MEHTKRKKILVSIFLLIGILLVAVLSFIYVQKTYFFTPEMYTEGMAMGFRTQCYQNTVEIADIRKADFNYDVKYVHRDAEKTRLVDCANGFVLDFPTETGFDFSRSEFGTRAIVSDDYIADVSREYSPYDDVQSYIEHYYNRFMLASEFQKNNNITLHENTTRTIGEKTVRIISLTRTPYPGSEIVHNSYTFAYIIDPERPKQFIRLMLKARSYDPATADRLLESLVMMQRKGTPAYVIDTTPVMPNWNEETQALYDQLKNSDDIMWGVYTHKLIDPSGLSDEVNRLEGELDYTFPLVMGYTYLADGLPLKGMEEAHEAGKAIELTLQISTPDNAGLDSLTNPNFEVLDGQKDEELRIFARQLRDYSHPVIFRLNNEMNTDWTSYSGVVCLSDPDIYKQVHARVFRIFQEEGVDNVIWTFNPQYGNYPPASWNHYMNYYPGNEQIQLLGVTAYNTGTYYQEENAETWRSFDELYSAASELYMRDFADMPWIITEFSCSSYGGNKANWIRNMFADIKKYKNIKAAVWFHFADYATKPDGTKEVARPYFLDETPETLQAFKDGLHGIITQERLPE